MPPSTTTDHGLLSYDALEAHAGWNYTVRFSSYYDYTPETGPIKLALGLTSLDLTALLIDFIREQPETLKRLQESL